ncbi:hypothetical protein [Halohasta litorea]|uniref:PD(D/E)XK endonuclease domain-containing protein n=1 Tax=Halohasta litorea TaxID=869891 RepID=A0ABD6D817_9EURY|nr:hypothetical protein [Halohasta litorea]
MSRAASSKRGGENAESAVIQRHPELEYVADTEARHYDARVSELLCPSPMLPFVGLCVLEVGTVVEIKSAMAVYGQSQRRGRFQLRRKQHQRLVDEAGVYLFAVCEPRPERSVIAAKVVPATSVSSLVFSWIDTGDRADYAQLAWSRIFDESEVRRGSP